MTLPGALGLSGLASDARSQVVLAVRGRPLARPQDAAGAARFMEPAQSTAEANVKVGFWLAVASRIAKQRLLAATATVYIVRGQALSLIPFVLDSRGIDDIVTIYQQGAEDAETNGAKSVGALLRKIGTNQAIEDARWSFVWKLAAGAAVLGLGFLALRRGRAPPRWVPIAGPAPAPGLVHNGGRRRHRRGGRRAPRRSYRARG